MRSSGLLRIIFIAFVLLVIGLFAYHKYTRHQRCEHISRFDYLPNDSIDYNYYDQTVLQTYLNNCARLTSMSKKLWIRNGVDIHKDSTGFGEIQSQINKYNWTLKYTRILEGRLKDSKDMKDGGLTNDVIKMVFEEGITVGALENEKDKEAAYEFLKGKNISSASKPNEIWELQKLLNANDYNLSINGVYDASTDSALIDFQKSNNLYPSHICDDMTLKKLTE